MGRKTWHAFSGLLQRELSATTEIVSTLWEVGWFGSVQATFATEQEAQAYYNTEVPDWIKNLNQAFIRTKKTTSTRPAETKGVAVVPLTPLPVFTSPGKVLTTRGFWDVVSATTPAGPVSNFAFGMTFLPVKMVYDVTTLSTGSVEYALRDPSPSVQFPDPLLHDVGWFCYDSFVRVTTDVNQDPPFHSKTNKRFSESTALCVVAGVEVAVDNLQSLRLDFGIRFRVLIES